MESKASLMALICTFSNLDKLLLYCFSILGFVMLAIEELWEVETSLSISLRPSYVFKEYELSSNLNG